VTQIYIIPRKSKQNLLMAWI